MYWLTGRQLVIDSLLSRELLSVLRHLERELNRPGWLWSKATSGGRDVKRPPRDTGLCHGALRCCEMKSGVTSRAESNPVPRSSMMDMPP